MSYSTFLSYSASLSAIRMKFNDAARARGRRNWWRRCPRSHRSCNRRAATSGRHVSTVLPSVERALCFAVFRCARVSPDARPSPPRFGNPSPRFVARDTCSFQGQRVSSVVSDLSSRHARAKGKDHPEQFAYVLPSPLRS